MTYLHGLHDPGGEWTMNDKPGWIVHTVALSEVGSQDFAAWSAEGYKNLVRLNWGYGSTGTIPSSDQYQMFAQRCADFVAASPGIDYCILANEPNHEQEWPNHQQITATQYAKCFDLCYKAIHARVPHAKVCLAAVAPWNVSAGDWLAYYRTMLETIQKCDGFAIHAYTHGTDPLLIYSDEMRNGWFWHFPVYAQTIHQITDLHKFPAELPVFITETDQGDDPWADVNSGWVKNAFDEIAAWNAVASARKVHALCLYRWQKHEGDRWWIEGKNGVIADFEEAVAKGYTVNTTPVPPTPYPPISPPEPTPEPTPEPERRDIDPALIARGVEFEFATVSPGQGYWRVVQADWLDEDEADRVGPDHHILGSIEREDSLAGDIPFMVTWPSGFTTVRSKTQAYNGYNYDYPMSKSLNEYSIYVNDGNPSDKVSRIGMGKDGNSGIHTSTWIEWEWTIATVEPGPGPTPPTDEVQVGEVIAELGLNVRHGPGTNFAVLGTLSYGSTVLYDDRQGDWLHVIDGWVSGEYVGKSSPPTPLPPPTPTPGGLVHPLPRSVITQHFYENRANYEQWNLPGHDGTDLGGRDAGTPIAAFAAGTVWRVDADADYGNYLMVYHPDRLAISVYCHCTEVLVYVGQDVVGGQHLATVGSTGNSTGPHLHFEIRLTNADGTYREDTPMRRGRVDPESYCAMNGLKL